MREEEILKTAKDRGERYMLVFIKHQEDAEPLEFATFPKNTVDMMDEKRWWTRKARGYSLKHIYDLEA
jgi:hypothetical protein